MIKRIIIGFVGIIATLVIGYFCVIGVAYMKLDSIAKSMESEICNCSECTARMTLIEAGCDQELAEEVLQYRRIFDEDQKIIRKTKLRDA